MIPCSGWYEWKIFEEDGKKQKFRFHAPDESPLFMAGIWFGESATPSQLVTLTTHPTTQCAQIHHRMPLLLQSAQVPCWLKDPPAALETLLRAPDLPLLLTPEEPPPIIQTSFFRSKIVCRSLASRSKCGFDALGDDITLLLPGLYGVFDGPRINEPSLTESWGLLQSHVLCPSVNSGRKASTVNCCIRSMQN